MGYSCTKAADDTLKEITERFRYQNTGNTIQIGNHAPIFYEIGREQPDGAITGTVSVFCDAGPLRIMHNAQFPELEAPQAEYARKIGGLRIEPDGTVTRFAGLPRKHWPKPKPKRFDFARG